jgi:hypothetical protein
MSDPIFRDPRFDALRNALYHTERRNFLDLLNRFLNLLVILLGAGVAGKAARLIHIEENWLELGVVFFATLQLVFDLGGRARDHQFLQRRYYELLAEMENENLDDEAIRRKWSAKLITISGDEPMPMRALDAIAYNKALSATCDDPATLQGYRQHVSFLQRRLRHIFAYHAASFPLESEYVNTWCKFRKCLKWRSVPSGT